MATYLCPGRPLYNGHLSTKAIATKARPQQSVFSETDEKVKNGHEIWFVWCFDDKSRQSYFDCVPFIMLQ